jgi:hypothetical protein
MNETGLHWLAGLLEGEGTFGTVNSRVAGKCYRYPRVSVLMSDEDVILRVCKMWCVKPFSYNPKPPSRKRLYRATKVGFAAAVMMRTLKPLMGTRRQEQITKALLEYDARPSATESRRASMILVAKTKPRNEAGQFA